MEPAAPSFTTCYGAAGEPVFFAFDVLWMDGDDMRLRPLVERKRLLRSIIPEQSSAMLYARHIEREGKVFYRIACEQDLEGIVAKLKHGAYGEGWFKIRNPGIRNTRGDGSCLRRNA